MMIQHINKLVEGFYTACQAFVLTHHDTVHLMVRASTTMLKDNPVLAQYVAEAAGNQFVVLNVAPRSIRNFAFTATGIEFDSRFKGVDHRLTIQFGDMIGMSNPGNEMLFDFASVLVSSVDGTGMILRPVGSNDLASVDAEAEAVKKAEAKKARFQVVK